MLPLIAIMSLSSMSQSLLNCNVQVWTNSLARSAIEKDITARKQSIITEWQNEIRSEK
jgi:hypothetical protein